MGLLPVTSRVITPLIGVKKPSETESLFFWPFITGPQEVHSQLFSGGHLVWGSGFLFTISSN